MTDQHNAKNQLAELLKSIGQRDNEITEYQSKTINNQTDSTLVVTFSHGLTLQ